MQNLTQLLMLKLPLAIFFLLNNALCIAQNLETPPAVEASSPTQTENPLPAIAASPMVQKEQEVQNSQQDNIKKEINAIVAIKPKPVKNPHALLVEMAFKFKAGGNASHYKEVHEHYCKAARDGNADAQFALGWMYEHGKGGAADFDMANIFYHMAAEQQHDLALKTLREREITVIQMAPTLPICMLPDPPAVIAPTLQEMAVDQVSENAISDRTAALFMSQKQIYKIVNKIANKYKIDADLVMSFIAIESGFDVLATSPRNAQGLMQLIPETATRFGVKDAYKPEENIKGGIAYLQWLLAYYQGNIELVAAAYNAGEKAVDRYKGVPPYEETKLYVKKIAKLYNRLIHPYKENWVPASPMLNSNFISTNNKRQM